MYNYYYNQYPYSYIATQWRQHIFRPGYDPCSNIEYPDKALLYEEIVDCIGMCTFVCFSNPSIKNGCWKIVGVQGDKTNFDVWFQDCAQEGLMFNVNSDDINAMFDCWVSHCPFEPSQHIPLE